MPTPLPFSHQRFSPWPGLRAFRTTALTWSLTRPPPALATRLPPMPRQHQTRGRPLADHAQWRVIGGWGSGGLGVCVVDKVQVKAEQCLVCGNKQQGVVSGLGEKQPVEGVVVVECGEIGDALSCF
jgi:hypothetical protein